MPNPKHKHSKARTRTRRAHDKAEMPAVVNCANCGAPHLYHRVCKECGQYRGKVVFEKEIAG
jgi:large subunit ribosomal protein L32